MTVFCYVIHFRSQIVNAKSSRFSGFRGDRRCRCSVYCSLLTVRTMRDGPPSSLLLRIVKIYLAPWIFTAQSFVIQTLQMPGDLDNKSGAMNEDIQNLDNELWRAHDLVHDTFHEGLHGCQ